MNKYARIITLIIIAAVHFSGVVSFMQNVVPHDSPVRWFAWYVLSVIVLAIVLACSVLLPPER